MAALLIIFVKEPVPGQVKTRLCPPLSPEAAAELYRLFTADVLEEMGNLPGIRLALAYSPPEARAYFQKLAPPEVLLFPQVEAGLGERLAAACRFCFEAGFAPVLLRNSDSPDLPASLVLRAAGVLAAGRAEVTLGPCPDGGYYLVGLRAFYPGIFHGIDWSSQKVLAQSLARSRELDLRAELLPSWPDIDTPEDLLGFLKQDFSSPVPGWRSLQWGKARLLPGLASFLSQGQD